MKYLTDQRLTSQHTDLTNEHLTSQHTELKNQLLTVNIRN